MKFLLLALVLGVVYGENKNLMPKQVNGDWRTLYTGSDCMDKISEGGPLRTYYHHLECNSNCENITVTFYLKLNENCTLITVVDQQTTESSCGIFSGAGRKIHVSDKLLQKFYQIAESHFIPKDEVHCAHRLNLDSEPVSPVNPDLWNEEDSSISLTFLTDLT